MKTPFAEWAQTYDDEPNPLTALGDRVLAETLGDLSGLRVLDAGCGTGRWMRQLSGVTVFGFDAEPAMLGRAPRGSVVLGAFGSSPFLPHSFDLVVAAFSLSYAAEPDRAVRNLCALVRPGGRLVVVDLAAEALAAGWKRTFGRGGRTLEIPSQVEALDAALREPPAEWRVESSESFGFGAPEKPLFDEARWRRVEEIPAARVTVLRNGAPQ